MPNKNAQIKFNAAYLRAIEEHVANVRRMYEKINPKVKYLHINNLTRSIRALQAIKDYAAYNGVRIPRVPYGPITHDTPGHKFLAKGALAIKQLRNATQATAAKLGAKALDCVVVFENQLP
jgi:hypothetical protein